jgi:hypothetical protein
LPLLLRPWQGTASAAALCDSLNRLTSNVFEHSSQTIPRTVFFIALSRGRNGLRGSEIQLSVNCAARNLALHFINAVPTMAEEPADYSGGRALRGEIHELCGAERLSSAADTGTPGAVGWNEWLGRITAPAGSLKALRVLEHFNQPPTAIFGDSDDVDYKPYDVVKHEVL